MLRNKHRSWSERWPVKQWRATKIKLARRLLEYLEPDQARVIGETVEQAIADKTKEWEIALLSIQAELDEQFDGGLLHGVPSVASLCQKIKTQTRAWRVENRRAHKLVNLLELDHPGQIVARVRELVQIDFKRESEKALFDDAFGAFKQAKNALNESLVIFYELQKSFELEDQIRNKLHFED